MGAGSIQQQMRHKAIVGLSTLAALVIINTILLDDDASVHVAEGTGSVWASEQPQELSPLMERSCFRRECVQIENQNHCRTLRSRCEPVPPTWAENEFMPRFEEVEHAIGDTVDTPGPFQDRPEIDPQQVQVPVGTYARTAYQAPAKDVQAFKVGNPNAILNPHSSPKGHIFHLTPRQL